MMRLEKLLVQFFLMALCIGLVVPQTVFAEDGAATYKAKCAACHGADGAGKIGPALKGTGLSDDDIAALLTKGKDEKKAPHKKAIPGLSDADAKAVADYVKSLK
jgi:mono/diheme cytochrome c family protein